MRAVAQLPVARGQDDRAEVTRPHAERREIEVVLDREPEEQARLLVRATHPELRARARRERGDVGAEKLDRPRGRREVAGDDVEERCLAGAVRPEDGALLAVGDVEIDVAHGVEAAEPPADPPQTEDRLGVLGCPRFGHSVLSR